MKALLARFCKYTFMSLIVMILLLLAHPRMSAHAAELVVSNSTVVCPNAGFTHIQDAVNAASPGDHIRICKGTYAEQVTINKAVALDADSGAVLMPGPMKQNTTSLFDALPIATALLVENTTNVTVKGLTVDGANNAISQCSPDLEGITFQNASGRIERVAVRNFKLMTASLNGCQSGTGIFVQSGGGKISNVEITDSTVHDYQKNGITANENGTQAFIRGNVVTGIGPTTGAAQNGIQIGFGAEGEIERNVVTNNIFSPCNATSCTAVATDILVTQSDGVEVSQNRAGISQVDIFVHGNRANIEGNETFATVMFDGIRVEGNRADVRRNQVFNGAESGIFILGDNSVVEDNVITEAPIGIFKDTSSMGNLISMNFFFDTPIRVQDPAVPGLAKAIQPKR